MKHIEEFMKQVEQDADHAEDLPRLLVRRIDGCWHACLTDWSEHGWVQRNLSDTKDMETGGWATIADALEALDKLCED